MNSIEDKDRQNKKLLLNKSNNKKILNKPGKNIRQRCSSLYFNYRLYEKNDYLKKQLV